MRRKQVRTTDLPPASRPRDPKWTVAIACTSLFVAIAVLYAPALNGHFILDDLSLPFARIGRDAPLRAWITGLRPVLMLSYWINYRLWGDNPFSYHLVNLFLHCMNTGLVYLVIARLLKLAGWGDRQKTVAAAVGALIFAIHPLQTESVSYVAGRSESLVSFFELLAYSVFLYRKEESISWRDSLIVLILFGAALLTKENAVSFAGILILTDLFWPPPFSIRGPRRNWRLYLLMLPGALAGAIAILRMLATAQTAGFSVSTFRWYQYAFTESRAIFSYIRMAVLPLGQSLDQDYPPSRTITEHGAIFFMVILAAIIAMAIIWRRRYPLSCFGLLMFLTCLAPTSSIIPIDDPLVERRVYLAMVGLILIGCEAACRLRVSKTTGICALAIASLVFGKLCHDRNRLWGRPDKLLEMAAARAVYNPRPLLNFTDILIRRNRCDLAPSYLQRAERILPNNYFVNAAWGRTLACLGHFDQAIQRLQTAARLQPCSQVYEWMGLVYATMGRLGQAGGVLKEAVRLQPNSETAHGSLALWYEKVHNFRAAEQEYRTALLLDRTDQWARIGLSRVRLLERAAPQ